jgi:hypothetical protein
VPLLLFAACATQTDGGNEAARGRGGKADAPGECTPDTCDGPGVGECYCDTACAMYGDCCSNYEPVCLGAPTDDGGMPEPDGGMPVPDSGMPEVDSGVPPMPSSSVPELGDGEIETIATSEHGLDEPRDLGFSNLHTDQLFITNRGDHSISIIHDFFGSSPTISKHAGDGSRHFCARPSGLAFGDTGIMATIHEEDEITQATTPWDFMGPTLHDTELPLFDAGWRSHIDMLHNSPNGVGIAHYSGNTFFVFDGLHESITMYDFQMDHGHGGNDHSDGVVRRYVEGQVGYVPDVASHLEVSGDLVYIADTGNRRIAVLDPSVGSLGSTISPNYDGSDQRRVEGGSIETLVDGYSHDLSLPSGLAIHDGRIFVSDASDGEIVAFDMDGTELGRIDTGPSGIMGLTVGPDGDLYFINATQETLGHVVR